MAKKTLWILILIMLICSACSNGENDEVPPLFQAVYDNNIAKIKEIVKSNSETINEKYLGNTVLHVSIFHSDVETIKFLVENGADFTIKDDSGSSPFFEAANMAYIDAIYYFLDKGANPNEIDNEGNTPIMKFTLRGGVPVDTHLEVLDRMLEAGADLTIKNNNGDTYYSIVKNLVESQDTLNEIEKRLPASMINN